MSAALPIVLFERSGGGPEAIADGCGIAVPYLNVGAMAKASRRSSDVGRTGRADGRQGKRIACRATYRFSDYADKIRSLAAGLESPSVVAVADI